MTAESTTKPRRRYRWIALVCFVLLLGGLGWSFFAQAASTRIYEIPSASMSPTIQMGDKVAARLGGALGQDKPKRGELWIFPLPDDGTGQTREAVKRVIGLPGETIAVENGKVVINGTPLDEPYLGAPMNYTMPPRTLGSSEYFMMGDKRNGSMDSTVFGPVPADRLRGKVIYRVWPPNRAGSL